MDFKLFIPREDRNRKKRPRVLKMINNSYLLGLRDFENELFTQKQKRMELIDQVKKKERLLENIAEGHSNYAEVSA